MKKLIYVLLFFWAVSCAISPGTAIAIASWCIEGADAPKFFSHINGTYQRVIAVDRRNNPHIAYGGDHLYYTYHDGRNWNYETVDTSPGVGDGCSIALDAEGKAHISYYDSINNRLKYATNKSGTWITETVDSGGSDTSIALDPEGKVHISYAADFIKYATNKSGSWVTETVSTKIGSYPSLALDADGNAHISYDYVNYNDPLNSTLQYAANRSGIWVVEIVDRGTVGESRTSLAVDAEGKAHISYEDFYFEHLKYATNKSGTWVTETLAEYAGGVTSLALDSEGRVHISYTIPDLKYTTNKSGDWVTETVDGPMVAKASIALDAEDRVHLSYFFVEQYDNYDLKYATNKSGAWAMEMVDASGADVGQYTSLALDAEGKAHISYCDATDYDFALKYATNKNGTWVTETVDSEGTVGEYDSLALDAEGKAHISYYDNTNRDLKYATNKSGVWVLETVDSPEAVGYSSSLALDAEGKAHISYLDVTNRVLKYATNMSGIWITETVDSATEVSLADSAITSLALDAEGKAHISYLNDTDYDFSLKYATNKSGTWVTETVDSEGTVGQYASLALDAEGKAHISYVYYPGYNYVLKYATNKTGAWVTETVDSFGFASSYTSLALDAEGKAHVSYLDPIDSINGDLKYATNKSGTWVTESVDSTGFVGTYASLALDGVGRPHISYYDQTTYDLKYASIDQDGDDVCFNQDNCPDYFNPDQQDSDGDGVGDVCDPIPISSSTTSSVPPSTTTTSTGMETSSSSTSTVSSTTTSTEGCSISIDPQSGEVLSRQSLTFTVNVTGDCDESDYEWSVDSEICSGCNQSGKYTAGINIHVLKPATDVVRVVDHGNDDISAEATVTVPGGCPLIQIYGEDSEEVRVMRGFRDNLLSQTPEGREFIKLYYQWSPFVVNAMQEDEQFKKEVIEIIEGILLTVKRVIE